MANARGTTNAKCQRAPVERAARLIRQPPSRPKHTTTSETPPETATQPLPSSTKQRRGKTSTQWRNCPISRARAVHAHARANAKFGAFMARQLSILDVRNGTHASHTFAHFFGHANKRSANAGATTRASVRLHSAVLQCWHSITRHVGTCARLTQLCRKVRFTGASTALLVGGKHWALESLASLPETLPSQASSRGAE